MLLTDDPAQSRLLELLSDPLWRLNNLYWIIGKDGREVLFKMNSEQEQLYRDRWYQNVILKARQLGFSTLICLIMLDSCLFDKNTACGIVDAKLDDAESKIAKIKFAYDKLPADLKTAIPLVKANASEIEFANGSKIRASTSHRGGTLQILHVSEYGKICAKYPERAREIRTGALNTIQAGQIVYIESTAEGASGGFYDLCNAAERKLALKTPLTALDFKFHFFPWWKAAEYAVNADGVEFTPEDNEYFAGLEAKHGVSLTIEQRAWYVKKRETQYEDMKREFPSTSKEAFEASVEGAYYARLLASIEMKGQIGSVPHNPSLPVYTAWDLGIGDDTSIWFAQRVAGWFHIIDHYATNGEAASHYVEVLKRKPYTYASHYLPHDADNRDWTNGKSRLDVLKSLGLENCRVIPRMPVDDGINAVRLLLTICRFDVDKCAGGLRSLRQYRREFDEARDTFKPTPLHDKFSHDADAFRYLAVGMEPDAAVPPDIPRYSGRKRRWQDNDTSSDSGWAA
jgi:hypothetical protein